MKLVDACRKRQNCFCCWYVFSYFYQGICFLHGVDAFRRSHLNYFDFFFFVVPSLILIFVISRWVKWRPCTIYFDRFTLAEGWSSVSCAFQESVRIGYSQLRSNKGQFASISARMFLTVCERVCLRL